MLGSVPNQLTPPHFDQLSERSQSHWMNLMNETTPHFLWGRQEVKNNDNLAIDETLNVIKPAELWFPFLWQSGLQRKEKEGEKVLPLLPFLNYNLLFRQQAPKKVFFDPPHVIMYFSGLFAVLCHNLYLSSPATWHDTNPKTYLSHCFNSAKNWTLRWHFVVFVFYVVHICKPF